MFDDINTATKGIVRNTAQETPAHPTCSFTPDSVWRVVLTKELSFSSGLLRHTPRRIRSCQVVGHNCKHGIGRPEETQVETRAHAPEALGGAAEGLGRVPASCKPICHCKLLRAAHQQDSGNCGKSHPPKLPITISCRPNPSCCIHVRHKNETNGG